ncbi:MAG TPA: class I SAM-dependent methyltransferase [Alphaproteobacteria bacterium]|nr:class I SAM-dependent methyltransferase [Alphaproteobacteria bacterium]
MTDTFGGTSMHRLIGRIPLARRAARRMRAFLGARAEAPSPEVTTFPQSIPHIAESVAEKGDALRAAIREYCAVHGDPQDPVRVVHLFHQIEAANKLPPGDYIELGVHKGFTLRAIHRFMDQSRSLFALDTFEGFDERDITVEHRLYQNDWHAGNFSPTTEELVGRFVGHGERPANLHIVKGWFPDSFRGLEDRRWRFVHIDFDLYQPVKTALETVWDAVLPGGIVMVHDYGCYGFRARLAVDEFCGAIGVLPIELGDRWGTAVLRKPLATRL